MDKINQEPFNEEVISKSPIVVNVDSRNDITVILEQYKVVVDSLNNVADTREKANFFWITLHSFLGSAIAYLMQFEKISQINKSILLSIFLILGFFMSLSWLLTLLNVKKIVDINNHLLIEIEKYLPVKIYTNSIKMSSRHKNRTSLTIKETMIALLFLFAYGAFALIFLYFQGKALIIN
jgi:hypothetical protein